MANELQTPYSTDDIQRKPFAVLLSVFLGLLLMAISAGVYVYKSDKERIDTLIDRADAEKAARIQMYEQMIFYKTEKERVETEQYESDSLVRERTGPYVEQILKR